MIFHTQGKKQKLPRFLAGSRYDIKFLFKINMMHFFFCMYAKSSVFWFKTPLRAVFSWSINLESSDFLEVVNKQKH